MDNLDNDFISIESKYELIEISTLQDMKMLIDGLWGITKNLHELMKKAGKEVPDYDYIDKRIKELLEE